MYETIFYIILIIVLIIFNGYLSMAELAIVSCRKGKLHQLVNQGNKHAQIVLELLDDSSEFLSTIQIGITLIGILTGAFGGATLAEPLAEFIGPSIPYIGIISLLIVVIITTYLSLIIGELAPKRIGLNAPEKVSLKVARSMQILTRICKPFAVLLSKSSDAFIKMIGIKSNVDNAVTEEEIELMIEEGMVEGNIEKEEKDIIKRVFKLDDQKVDRIMTPRSEIVWVDLEDTQEENRKKIIESKRSIFPVASGELDDFIGVVQAKDILRELFKQKNNINIEKIIRDPLVVPENLESLDLLKKFKENDEYVHMSLVVDEFGSLVGLITLNDLLEGIVGDIPGIDENDDPQAIQRGDGKWIIDGRYQINRFKELFDFNEEFPDEKEDNYSTIAGFILSHIGEIPKEGEKIQWEQFCFEIIDIDGHQIDKILVNPLNQNSKNNKED